MLRFCLWFKIFLFVFLRRALVVADFIDARFGLSVADRTPKLKAGLFTPFVLSPGGGERYFLTSALAVMKMGFEIDIIVYSDTQCITTSCIDDTLTVLRIDMKSDQFKIRVVTNYEELLPGEYDVFYVMGISKYPEYRPVGRFNVYMCQFPFDLYSKKLLHPDYFSAYDQVIVNSRFTHDWYLRGTQRGVGLLMKSDKPFPTISIVHPPVQPFEIDGKKSTSVSDSRMLILKDKHDKHLRSKHGQGGGGGGGGINSSQKRTRVNVAICGRFFRGRQSKGHDHALRLLVAIKARVSIRVHLFMIGFIHPDQGSFDYVEELRQNATDAGMSVSFLINAEGYEIADALAKSTIFWHLTGAQLLGNPSADVASYEHFGIAIVEAMYCGCIPIVTSLGGVTDIVTHGHDGFLAQSLYDFMNFSVTIINSPPDQVNRLKRNAMASATRFSVSSFFDTLQAVITRGQRAAVIKTIGTVRSVDVQQLVAQATYSRTKLTAILIEGGLSTNIKLCVRNVVHHLGIGWRVHIYYSLQNGNDMYLRGLLKDVRAQFIPLNTPVLTKADYDELLKSKAFWERYAKDEKLLFFSSDTFLLRKGIERFWSYDFISAPMLHELQDSQRTVTKDSLVLTDDVLDYKTLFDRGVGHGSGLSLRTAGAMLKIARMYGNETSAEESEGIFFARHAKQLGYKVANYDVSYNFSWEAEFPEFRSSGQLSLPLGVHGIWLHTRPDLINGLLIRNILPTKDLTLSEFPSTKHGTIELLLGSGAVVANTPATVVEIEEEEGEGEEGEAAAEDEEKEDGGAKAEAEGESAEVPAQEDPAASSYAILDGKSKSSFQFWKFIHTPAVLLGGDATKMSKLLDNLGVLSVSDLKECTDDHIKSIIELVKPVQRNKLLSIINPPST